MNICIIIPHFMPHVGGAEQLFFDIAKGLQEKGYTIRVVTSSSGGLKGHMNYKGVDTYYYNWHMFSGHPIVRKKDLVKHIQWADVVHTSFFTTAVKAKKLASEYEKPCVATIHEVLGNKWMWIGIPKWKALLFDIYERYLCLHQYDGYHFVSKTTELDYEKYCGKCRGEKIVAYPVINLLPSDSFEDSQQKFKEFFNLKADEKGFLFYGRPTSNKGIFVLEQAVEILKQKAVLPNHIKFCWILAKDPAAQREKVLNKVRKGNISQNVIVRPSLKEKKDLYNIILGADYVVIPSITEGFGLCAVDACSLNKKVVYSSGGSLPEVVWGECLEFKNRSAKDLARKLYQIIREGDLAFHEVPKKTFDKEQTICSIAELYNNLIEKSC